MAASSATVCIFLRIKPPARQPFAYSAELRGDQPSADRPHVLRLAAGAEHTYSFDGILDVDASQEVVFQRVAQDAVQNVLRGFNSTIFAYGQTGSGKTYTVTGADDSLAKRGLIPRALQCMFSQLSQKENYEWELRLSYLQIYQEHHLTDLFNRGKLAKTMDQLPRVNVRFMADRVCQLDGLGLMRVVTEEEAMRLVYTGDLNKIFSETPMNRASSRSHCVFTVHFRGRAAGAPAWVCAKFHLVDLAGSERLRKTQSAGQLLQETKFINGSLFHLQNVISALAEGSPHVPYRDSQLTKVLADSLGGNCKTVMVANISSDASEFDESAATCRFAQRVARVTQHARVNEERDPAAVIADLQRRVEALQATLVLQGGAEEAPLTEEEVLRCREVCDEYLVCPSESAAALREVQGSVQRTLTCFAFLRDIVRGLRRQLLRLDPAADLSGADLSDASAGGPAPAGEEEGGGPFQWWQRHKQKSLSRRRVSEPPPLPSDLLGRATHRLEQTPLSDLGVTLRSMGSDAKSEDASASPRPSPPDTARPSSAAASAAERALRAQLRERDRRIAELQAALRGAAPPRGPAPDRGAELAQDSAAVAELQAQLRLRTREKATLLREKAEWRQRLQAAVEDKEAEVAVLLARINKLDRKAVKWKKRAKGPGPKSVSFGFSSGAEGGTQPAGGDKPTGPKYTPIQYQPRSAPAPATAADERETYQRLQARLLERQQLKQQEAEAHRARPRGPDPTPAAAQGPSGPETDCLTPGSSAAAQAEPTPRAALTTAQQIRDVQSQQVSLVAAAQTLQEIGHRYQLNLVHDLASSMGKTVLDMDQEEAYQLFSGSAVNLPEARAMREEYQQLVAKAKQVGGELQLAVTQARQQKLALANLNNSVPQGNEADAAAELERQRAGFADRIAAAQQRVDQLSAAVRGLKAECERHQLQLKKMEHVWRRDFDTWWSIVELIANS